MKFNIFSAFSTFIGRTFTRKYIFYAKSQIKACTFGPFITLIFASKIFGKTQHLIFCDEKPKIYSQVDLNSHRTHSQRIWVSYKHRVYDITDFVDIHPGGKIILQAAGKDLEPFFDKFSFHKHESIVQMLDTYYIGDLIPEDRNNINLEEKDEFSDEPTRSTDLIVNSQKPFNAESPTDKLTDSFNTPSDIFFVRNHNPVPSLNPQEYEISICIQKDLLPPEHHLLSDATAENFEIVRGREDICLCKTIKLRDLMSNFPSHDVDATFQCSGNRRSEMNDVKPVQGLNWKGGAIGNATWSGVKIESVLAALGLPLNHEKSKSWHARFIGSDSNSSDEYYEASVPLGYVLGSDSLFAFKMNHEDLIPDHGFPVRVVVPGITGARNVKWLQKVIIASEESQSRWQIEDYRCYSPDKRLGSKFDLDVPAIQETPVTSYISTPSNGSKIKFPHDSDNVLNVKGYAYSGGGRGIARVELSIDGGSTWIPAKLSDSNYFKGYNTYTWTLWSVDVPVSQDSQNLEIICKAVDSSYNHQPESSLPIWNMRGLLNNSWHRIKVDVI